MLLIDSPPFFLPPVLLPLLARNLHLRFVARTIDRVHFFLTDELLPRHFAVGVVDFLEPVEGCLQSSFGRNPPMTNSDLMVARLVFDTDGPKSSEPKTRTAAFVD